MSEEKKIFVDEDWKSKVAAEREAQQRQEPASQTEAAAPADPQMPPASLEMLLSTLATEAMMALGQIPHPITGEATYHPNQAKYLIDTIEVLEEKTKGNVSPIEAKAMENLLHQLRMVFVAGPPATSPQDAGSAIDVPPPSQSD